MPEDPKNPMRIWDAVWRTEQRYTRQVTIGGRRFTSINPQSQIRAATQLWGPYGTDWGARNVREELITLGDVTLVKIQIDLYYPGGVVEGVFGCARLCYPSKNRVVVDDDAHKKAATDAQSKALSKLGFNGDVFLGLWDDVKYQQWRQQQ